MAAKQERIHFFRGATPESVGRSSTSIGSTLRDHVALRPVFTLTTEDLNGPLIRQPHGLAPRA